MLIIPGFEKIMDVDNPLIAVRYYRALTCCELVHCVTEIYREDIIVDK